MGVAGAAGQAIVQPEAAARRLVEGDEGLGVSVHAPPRGLAAVVDNGGAGADLVRSRARVGARVGVRVGVGVSGQVLTVLEREMSS